MKRCVILLTAALGCFVGFDSTAQQPPASPQVTVQRQGVGYAAFPLVQYRHVFDPERKADPRPNGAVQQATTPTPTTHDDYVALTGTMVTADKALAFFSGSRPDFNKVLAIKDQIAGATLLKVTPSNIEVERGGKHIVVAVGQTVPLDNASAPAAAPALAAGSNADPNAPAKPPAAATDKDEVLRRLMERRQQELK